MDVIKKKAPKDQNMDDQWITMKGTHVLIDDGGQVSKGPDKLKKVVKSGGGYKAKSKMEKDADKFHKELQSWNDVDFPEDTSEAVDMEKSEKKRMEDKLNKFSRLMHEPDREENKEYSYGPGEEAVGETSYGRFPTGFKMGGREHTSPDDVKKIRETVSRFMKNAKEGDVYTTGGGVGSAGGTKFKVVRSRGKLGLAWEKDGYYLRPVQMSRQNVEKFISNGAKLVRGTASKTPKREYSYGSSDDRGKSYEKIARSLKQYNKHEYPVEWKKAAEQWNDAYDKASAEEKKIMHKILKDYGL